MAKLSTLLKSHVSTLTTPEIKDAKTLENASGEVSQPGTLTLYEDRKFPIPGDEGQSVPELVDETAPGYLRACLEMANRAMTGNVDPMKEGDLPHKMALMLAHKMIPARKFNDKPPEEAPAEVKKTARALKSLIKSLTDDGEIIMDHTVQSSGQEHGRSRAVG